VAFLPTASCGGASTARPAGGGARDDADCHGPASQPVTRHPRCGVVHATIDELAPGDAAAWDPATRPSVCGLRPARRGLETTRPMRAPFATDQSMWAPRVRRTCLSAGAGGIAAGGHTPRMAGRSPTASSWVGTHPRTSGVASIAPRRRRPLIRAVRVGAVFHTVFVGDPALALTSESVAAGYGARRCLRAGPHRSARSRDAPKNRNVARLLSCGRSEASGGRRLRRRPAYAFCLHGGPGGDRSSCSMCSGAAPVPDYVCLHDPQPADARGSRRRLHGAIAARGAPRVRAALGARRPRTD
jgi:hypothetical protein